MATSGLTAQMNGVAEWRINCDEPVSLDYNVGFKSTGQVTTSTALNPIARLITTR
jgi:predicted extracellular nuclease